MGIRGEIFSTNLKLKNRTYFFNVKENRMGDLYLNVVESKNQETGGFERQSVVIFNEDMAGFLEKFDDALKELQKAVRDKKKLLATLRNRRPDDRARKPQEDRTSAPNPEDMKLTGKRKVIIQKKAVAAPAPAESVQSQTS
jgi:hypothetical protein